MYVAVAMTVLLLLMHEVASVALCQFLNMLCLSLAVFIWLLDTAAVCCRHCVAVIVHTLSNALLTTYCPICDKLSDGL